MRVHIPLLGPLLPLSVCLMIGIALSGWLDYWPLGLIIMVGCIVITLLLHHSPKWQTAGIWVCTLLLGLTLGARKQQQLEVDWPKEALKQSLVVTSEPVMKERWVTFEALTTKNHRKLKLYIARDKDSEKIRIGEGLVIKSIVRPIHKWQDGHFNYLRYMQCQGFAGEAFVHSNQWKWQEHSLKELPLLERTRLRFLCWRHLLIERYKQWNIDEQTLGVIAAMTLGDKTHLDKQLKDIYAQGGTAHILALSGLHITIIYNVIILLVSWQRAKMLSQILIVLSIWAFALLTGLSPSIVRSATMISLYALLSLGHRKRMSANTLAFAALLMLVANPLTMCDVGFQLSFIAVLAIVLINPVLYGLIPLHIQQQHRWLSYWWGLTTVTLSAQIGTAPLVMYYFGYFPTWFLLANYLVIPLAMLVLYLAIGCWLATLCGWPLIASWAIAALATVTTTMNHLLSFIAQLPLSCINGISLSASQVLLIYIIICTILRLFVLRFGR